MAAINIPGTFCVIVIKREHMDLRVLLRVRNMCAQEKTPLQGLLDVAFVA